MANNPPSSAQEQLSRLEKSLFQLSEVIQQYQEIVQKRFKVSSVEVDILRCLEEEGEMKMKDIGSRVNVKLSNLTNIVDRLESQRLVKRVNSKTDRRSIYVHITAKGSKLLDNYGVFLRELSSRMKSEMKEDQFGILVEGLEKISNVPVQE
jgi:DNA-binding MarR family transcriptional regulator